MSGPARYSLAAASCAAGVDRSPRGGSTPGGAQHEFAETLTPLVYANAAFRVDADDVHVGVALRPRIQRRAARPPAERQIEHPRVRPGVARDVSVIVDVHREAQIAGDADVDHPAGSPERRVLR